MYLNVWTPLDAPEGAPSATEVTPDGETAPAPASPSLLPVAVFIHGGQFSSGFGGGPDTVYDASDVTANTRSIWVTLNYRLGALGFLYLGDEESGTGVTGNYGLQDQELALRWVARHAASFGGDASRVTLVGQSAGALSVVAHMSRPAVHSLFARAVLHSPPLSLPFRDAGSQLGKLAPKVARAARCLKHHPKRADAGDFEEAPVNWRKTAACMRRLSMEALLDAQESGAGGGLASLLTDFAHAGMPYTPTVGTPYLPHGPLDALTLVPGTALADVPLLLGSTAAEGDLFVFGPSGLFREPVDEFMYSLGVSFALGMDRSSSIDTAYPRGEGDKEDMRAHIARVLGDGLFTCPARAAAKAHAGAREGRSRTSRTWLWAFNHSLSFGPAAWGEGFPACHEASCHGTDLLTLFRPNVGLVGGSYTRREAALSSAMQGYWGEFLHTGDPDDGAMEGTLPPHGARGVKKWMPFAGRHKMAASLGRVEGAVTAGGDAAVTGKVRDFRGDACETAWDAHGYKLG